MLFRSIFDLATKKSLLAKLQKEALAADLWDNPNYAQSLMKKIADLERDISTWQNIENEISSLADLFELDDGSLTEEISLQLDKIEKELEQREINLLLSGEYDEGNALLTIHAGAGGTDSQD